VKREISLRSKVTPKGRTALMPTNSGSADDSLSRRRFLQNGLVAGAVTAGIRVSKPIALSSITTTAQVNTAAAVLEDIRSAQDTVLELQSGHLEKVKLGVRAFLDNDEVLGYVPQEFRGRSFIRSGKIGVKAVCRKTGYVYAVTASNGSQAGLLMLNGFKRLDFREFEIFKDTSSKAIAFQKLVSEGEALTFGDWVILIFSPDESGGVRYSRMRSLARLPFYQMEASSRRGRLDSNS
jgi:hypothetical protein